MRSKITHPSDNAFTTLDDDMVSSRPSGGTLDVHGSVIPLYRPPCMIINNVVNQAKRLLKAVT
ncbi:MAG: hypothetical protein OEU26_26355 [Candidatus Tectomicrobia bacterium]|nr:hypothetical protein [Candidatus Tectomicrobia bacterium]